MHKFFIILALLLSWTNLFADNVCDSVTLISENINTDAASVITDSLTYNPREYALAKDKNTFQRTLDRVVTSPAYRISCVGVPLVVAGLIVKSENTQFRALRNEYLPQYRYHYDDYLQYSPAVAMVALKAFGVKSRSSWGRMLTSDAIAAAIMAGSVNLIKYTAKVQRPDGSTFNSFPSGHTATAFMCATMLHREYGERSYWYSVGAYSVAAFTGISRMLNNRHWLSDVMVGAGIGIISTELGYFLADLIFKDKGITHFYNKNNMGGIDKKRCPSFFGVNLGINLSGQQITLKNGTTIDLNTGSKASLEGAWFINPYVGVGAELSSLRMPIIANDVAQTNGLMSLSALPGVYASYPLSTYVMLGGKLLTGYTHYKSVSLLDNTVNVGNEGNFGVTVGLHIRLIAKHNLGISFYTDYSAMGTPSQFTNKIFHYFTLGTATYIQF